jgi:hypothetical protein
MRRDWNVIRTILLRVEEMSASDNFVSSDDLDDIESCRWVQHVAVN